MNIAIMADDEKKELLIQFCFNYCNILSKHKLIAEEAIAQLINKNTGLKIETILSSGQEGRQQLSSQIAYNEINMLIFFQNTFNNKHISNNDEIFERCNSHNVLLATNLVTAEALVKNL